MNRPTQAHHGHGHGGMPPPPPHHALARYGSAPGSFLAAVADIVHGGDAHPAPPSRQQPVSRFFSGAESSGLTSCESTCRTDNAAPTLQRAYGGSGEIHVPPPAQHPGLLRHSSSPAGLLSRLMADPHGNGGMAGTRGAVMGSYSQGAGPNGESMAQQRGLSSQWSFSSRQDMMPHISEMGAVNGMPPGAGDNIGESIATSDLSRSFSMGSWDDANSIMFSSPGKKAKVLVDGDDGMPGSGQLGSAGLVRKRALGSAGLRSSNRASHLAQASLVPAKHCSRKRNARASPPRDGTCSLAPRAHGSCASVWVLLRPKSTTAAPSAPPPATKTGRHPAPPPATKTGPIPRRRRPRRPAPSRCLLLPSVQRRPPWKTTSRGLLPRRRTTSATFCHPALLPRRRTTFCRDGGPAPSRCLLLPSVQRRPPWKPTSRHLLPFKPPSPRASRRHPASTSRRPGLRLPTPHPRPAGLRAPSPDFERRHRHLLCTRTAPMEST